MKHYIVTISFKVPIEAIGEHLVKQHFEVLQMGYESGHILLYGPSEPENGTILVARVESRKELGMALAADPLANAGLATYDFQEFIPVRFPPSLQGWVDPLEFHQSARLEVKK